MQSDWGCRDIKGVVIKNKRGQIPGGKPNNVQARGLGSKAEKLGITWGKECTVPCWNLERTICSYEGTWVNPKRSVGQTAGFEKKVHRGGPWGWGTPREEGEERVSCWGGGLEREEVCREWGNMVKKKLDASRKKVGLRREGNVEEEKSRPMKLGRLGGLKNFIRSRGLDKHHH